MKDVVKIWFDEDANGVERIYVSSSAHPTLDIHFSKDRRGIRRKVIKHLTRFYIEDWRDAGTAQITESEIENFVMSAWDLDMNDPPEEKIITFYPRGLGAGTASMVLDSVEAKLKEELGSNVAMTFAVVNDESGFRVVIDKTILVNPHLNRGETQVAEARLKARHPSADVYTVMLPVSIDVKNADFSENL